MAGRRGVAYRRSWGPWRWADCTKQGDGTPICYVNRPLRATAAAKFLQMMHNPGLAAALNDSDRLRILPIGGIGGPQNIRDVRYLKGIDIGLTQLSVLNNFRSAYQKLGKYDDKLVYIAKLFNEEVHLIGGREITSIEQLNGRKVNIGEARSGTSYTMRDVFKRLGIKIEEVNLSQTEAFERLKNDEVAATAYVAGKSAKLIASLRLERGIHFLYVT